MLAIVVVSCDRSLENELAQIDPAGENWTVKAYTGKNQVYGPFLIKTYKPSLGNDSINISDCDGKFWNFNVNTAVDVTGKSFQTQGSANRVSKYNIGVKVLNGKIVNDSIFFEIQFEDDETPYGTTYKLTGCREMVSE